MKLHSVIALMLFMKMILVSELQAKLEVNVKQEIDLGPVGNGLQQYIDNRNKHPELTKTPEPTTSISEPITTNPEPTTITPKPTTTTPESTTTTPEPTTKTPEPTTPESTMITPEPTTTTPESTTTISIPCSQRPVENYTLTNFSDTHRTVYYNNDFDYFVTYPCAEFICNLNNHEIIKAPINQWVTFVEEVEEGKAFWIDGNGPANNWTWANGTEGATLNPSYVNGQRTHFQIFSIDPPTYVYTRGDYPAGILCE